MNAADKLLAGLGIVNRPITQDAVYIAPKKPKAKLKDLIYGSADTVNEVANAGIELAKGAYEMVHDNPSATATGLATGVLATEAIPAIGAVNMMQKDKKND